MADEEVVKNGVVKLALDDTGFSAGMKNLNNQMKVIDSEFKASGAGVKDWGNTLDGLKANADALGQKITVQKQIVDAYNQQLEKSKNTLNNNIETMSGLKTKLDAAKSAYEQSKTTLGANDEATKKLKSDVDDLASKYSSSERAVLSANSSVNNYTVRVNEATEKLGGMQSELSETNEKIKNFGQETKTAGENVETASEKTSVFGDVLKANLTGEAIISALKAVASKVKEIAEQAIETADSLEKLSDETGLTTDQLQKMTYICDDLGVSLDTQTGALKKLINNMSSAQSGTGTAYAAFKKLHVEYEDGFHQLRDSNTVYGEVIDALGKMTNATERDAAAQDIFGKSATELNPLIKAGSDGLKTLGDQAEKTGAVMSDDAVAALDSLGDSIDHAKQKVTAFIGEGLAKVIESFATVRSLTSEGRALDEITKGTDEATQTTLAAAQVAQTYVDKLKELESTGLDTAGSQSEYKETVAELNALIPGLNLTIDEQTGKIDQNTASIEANINAWKKQAITQILQEQFKATVSELLDNETKLAMAQNKVSDANNSLNASYYQVALAFGYTGNEADAFAASLKDVPMDNLSDQANDLGKNLSGTLVSSIMENRAALDSATRQSNKYQNAVEEDKKSVNDFSKAQDKTAESLAKEYGITLDATGATEENTGTTDENTEAKKDNTKTTDKATLSLSEQVSQTKSLTSGIGTLNSALAEQAKNGELSTDTILSLTDAGYASILQVDAETGSVTINKQAYERLAQAKIDEQIASLKVNRSALAQQMDKERGATEYLARSQYDLAAAYLNVKAAQAENSAVDAQIMALEKAKSAIGKYTATVSSGGGSASKAVKTASEKAAESFKAAVSAIDYQLSTGVISEEQYWKLYSANMSKYLKKGTDDWKDADEKVYKHNVDSYNDLFKNLSDQFGDGKIDLKTFLADCETARDKYLKKNTTEWKTSYTEAFDQVKTVETQRLKDIKDDYDSSLKDIQDKIDSMQEKLLDVGDIATFKKDDDGGIASVDLSNLETQAKTITDFGTALDALKEKKVPESLLSQIASMDTNEGLALANKLIELSKNDTAWSAYLQAWDDKQAAAKKVAEAYYADDVKTLNDTLTTDVTDLQTDMTKAGLKLGGNISDGIVQGVKNGTIDVQNAMSSVISSAFAAAKKAAGIASPSKVARDEIGKQITAGVAQGITDNSPLAQESMSLTMDDMIAQAKELSGRVSGAIQTITAQVASNAPTPVSAQTVANRSIASDIVNGISAVMGAQGMSFSVEPSAVILDGRKVGEITYKIHKQIAKQKGDK